MKRSFGEYQRAAKSGSGSVWLGPDHLLVIESTGFLLPFTEKYRRIDYANIQSFFWTTSRRRGQLTVVIVLLLLILASAAYAARESAAGLSIWGGLALLMLVLGIVNWAKGPTADLRLQTAVQLLRLKPVKRVAKAEDLIRAVTPLCLAHQPAVEAGASPPTVAHVPSQSGALRIAGIKPPWPGSYLVRWALAVHVADGLLTVADLFIPVLAFSFVAWTAGITGAVLIIAAFTRSLRYELPRMVRRALAGSVAMLGVGFVLGIAAYVGVMVTGISSGEMTLEDLERDPNAAAMRYLAESSFEQLGWIGWALLGWGFLSAAIAALGLPGALSKAVESRSSPPPVPLPPPAPPLPPEDTRS